MTDQLGTPDTGDHAARHVSFKDCEPTQVRQSVGRQRTKSAAADLTTVNVAPIDRLTLPFYSSGRGPGSKTVVTNLELGEHYRVDLNRATIVTRTLG